MNKITRRAALAGIAAGAPLTVASFKTVAAEGNPLVEMEREYFALHQQGCRISAQTLKFDGITPEVEAIEDKAGDYWDAAFDVFKRMTETPAKTREGLEAKIRVVLHQVQEAGSNDENEGLVSALNDALRLGGLA